MWAIRYISFYTPSISYLPNKYIYVCMYIENYCMYGEKKCLWANTNILKVKNLACNLSLTSTWNIRNNSLYYRLISVNFYKKIYGPPKSYQSKPSPSMDPLKRHWMIMSLTSQRKLEESCHPRGKHLVLPAGHKPWPDDTASPAWC